MTKRLCYESYAFNNPTSFCRFAYIAEYFTQDRLKSKSFLHTCLIYSGGWMVVCVIISILDWLEDGEYVEWYELLGWCVIPPLLYCLIQYTKRK